jgi:muramidase (phage lysozyme)
MTHATAAQLGGANRCAFLDAIAWSEVGPALLKLTDDGYNVLVGATPGDPLTFPSYAAHPDVLNRVLDSTAAGRYQINHSTWLEVQAALSLPDFGPVSQDRAALWLARGALTFIDAGNLAEALDETNRTWASLPGSPYGQRTNTLADLETAYIAAGGTLA